MKYFNWLALNQVSFEDALIFLLWIDSVPSGEVTFSEIRDAGPVKSERLPTLLESLKYFGFLSEGKTRISLSKAGRHFIMSGAESRLALLRNFFLKGELGQKVVAQLHESGRLELQQVLNLFQGIYGFYISPSEITGFVEWGTRSRLFDFNIETCELVRLTESLKPTTVNIRVHGKDRYLG
jgi:hypothetical protein